MKTIYQRWQEREGLSFAPMNKQRQYAWGLGIATNIQAEYLALWQGLELAIARKISKNMVFGDSMIVIQQVWEARASQKSVTFPILPRIV